ncbi:MAG: tRNA lysidine(34) synthetase TilS [Crocinitomicaceae bacterium]|nr:tRNA lysidine(34) synthetase TilS [Crocinitomicaceae bacterium]
MSSTRENNIRFSKDLDRCGIIDGELILATCSGGPDSMLLLHALKTIGARFEVAHVNFKLRGEESDKDEEFISNWCKNNCVVFHSESMDAKGLADKTGKGIQDAARVLRYEYFESLKNKLDAHAIAVAHHENDQAETLLLHLLRSTNPSSLGCMSHRNGDVIRPLLNWTRDEIIAWLKLEDVEYRIDSSNASEKYTRNRIRHEVLPLLESIRKGTTGHLADWANRLRIRSNAVESAMSDASRAIVNYSDLDNGDGVLCKLDLHAMGSSIWGDLVVDRMLAERGWPVGSREEAMILKRSTVGASICYGGDILLRERDYLSLSRKALTLIAFQLERTLIDDLSDLSFPNDPSILWAGSEEIKEPTKWRAWEHGDKITPTGMDGSVNVSDLLTQWKVPHGARNSAHVLEDAEGDILWVYISFEDTVLSRVSRKVKVNLGEPIVAFKAS